MLANGSDQLNCSLNGLLRPAGCSDARVLRSERALNRYCDGVPTAGYHSAPERSIGY